MSTDRRIFFEFRHLFIDFEFRSFLPSRLRVLPCVALFRLNSRICECAVRSAEISLSLLCFSNLRDAPRHCGLVRPPLSAARTHDLCSLFVFLVRRIPLRLSFACVQNLFFLFGPSCRFAKWKNITGIRLCFSRLLVHAPTFIHDLFYCFCLCLADVCVFGCFSCRGCESLARGAVSTGPSIWPPLACLRPH